MNRQYIGARYVAKIYENSQNPLSAEWESNVNYEPLTIVTYNYGTYISKKTVTANIGNPSENGTYWTQTGFYNGQIANLQNQIDTINATIGTIQSEYETTAIYIGNSYTNGGGSSTGTRGLYALTKDLFDNASEYTADGIGFLTYTGHSTTFETELVSAGTSMSEADRAKVTHIIVISAYGDTRAMMEQTTPNLTVLDTAIASFITAKNTYFPNAKLYITLGEGVANSGISNESNFFMEYAIHDMLRTLATKNNYYYLGWIGWEITHNNSMFHTDGIHPNDIGYDILSRAFKSAFDGHYYPSIKQYIINTEMGGKATLIGTPEETQIKFSAWDTAYTMDGDDIVINFTNSPVIPAFVGWGADPNYTDSNYIESTLYPNRATMLASRFTFYNYKTDVNKLRASMTTNLTSGEKHVIQSPILIKHRWNSQ